MSTADTSQLVEIEDRSVTEHPVQLTPAGMLQIAVEQGADLGKLEKLMELHDRWEKNEAKKAFNVAIAEFNKNPPKVVKDKLNQQYGSRYSSKENLVNTVNSELSKYSLNARWDISQEIEGKVTVTCIMTHSLGHSEMVALSAPPDTSGSKNPIQQIKSTITYLEIATFEAVTGVVASDFGDDDGNSSGVELITKEQEATIEALIEEVEAQKKQFMNYFKVSELRDLPAQKYNTAIRMLEQKRNQ